MSQKSVHTLSGRIRAGAGEGGIAQIRSYS